MALDTTRVFISYHRNDLAIADQVRAFLTAQGILTWMDQYDIPSGAYWPDEIDKGLATANIVLGVLSPDAVESRNVKNEWDWALQNGKRLLLLLARPCVIPHRYVSINYIDATSTGLPEAMAMLIQAADLRPSGQHALPAPVTRYAQSGDLTIAYNVFGDGPVDLVLVPGYISHVEHAWTYQPYVRYFARLATLARVVTFDKRGTGMSDRTAGSASLEERMDDIRAVMDTAGIEQAVILGNSEGVPLSILFAATHPERVLGLIAYGGSATYLQHPDYPWGMPLEQYQAEIAEDERTLFSRWGTPEMAREVLATFVPSRAGDQELISWFAGLMRLGASPGAAIALTRMNMSIDVRSILPTVKVPTLVMIREFDPDVKLGEARYMAERIPDAQLAILPGNDHFAFLGDQDAYFTALGSFLDRLVHGIVNIEVQPSVIAVLHDVVARWNESGNATPIRLENEAEIHAFQMLADALAKARTADSTGPRSD